MNVHRTAACEHVAALAVSIGVIRHRQEGIAFRCLPGIQPVDLGQRPATASSTVSCMTNTLVRRSEPEQLQQPVLVAHEL